MQHYDKGIESTIDLKIKKEAVMQTSRTNLTLPRGKKMEFFSEESVLENLLSSSKEFIDFYNAERGKISGRILWTTEFPLPVGINASFGRSLLTGEYSIMLRRIPALITDAALIAHELEHIVLLAEGFHYPVITNADYGHIGQTITSMLQDPIVDQRLKSHGFNLVEKYRREWKGALRQMNESSGPPSEPLDRALWIINTTGKLLDAEMMSDQMTDQMEKEFIEFQQWVNERFPDILAEARELHAIIKKIGIDGPEQHSAIYSKIIQRYDLKGLEFKAD